MAVPRKDWALVGIQFTLFFVYLFRAPVLNPELGIMPQYIGLALFIVGLAVIALAFWALNRHLTAFPTPKEDGQLIQSGVYRFARHPIYTGILLSAAGFGIFTQNGLRLMIAGMLLILFMIKAGYEERLLLQKYPGYAAYKAQTGMFLPFF